MINNLYKMFLGSSPSWYKNTIIAFLIFNPIALYALNYLGFNGSFFIGWLLLLQFIFTLALALKCYPLQPGGLLAIQALLIGLTSPYTLLHEVENNLEVILLLVFMVAGIYFMKNLMLNIFTKLLLRVHSKTKLSLLFCFVAAFLSAFLDALTVTAVLIAVGIGFYRIFHLANSGADFSIKNHNILDDSSLSYEGIEDLENFKSFLRDLIMHGVVGTALGGVCTIVGEPQNLLIANIAGWEFIEFAVKMAPITIPVFIAGMITCFCVEKFRLFGFGTHLPLRIKNIFHDYNDFELSQRTDIMKLELVIEMVVGLFLIIALALHLAAVGIIGLGVIILLTSFKGITDEHDLGDAFKEALPFTALLVVFFAVVSVIADQALFSPIIAYVLAQNLDVQAPIFFVANGLLSAISDNVFVATIYINEIKEALDSGIISRSQFDNLAIAINTGTNIPSIATPNGQAAFLFLLTSSLAPLIGLSYMRMVKMALPYTIVLSIVGFLSVVYFL
ncbi:sodium/proton antiporter NhaB [Gammaproteobacteria bacterium]|jgi:NhaB family Na+:H+ antiporter|nr:sodium/proton antiporter NhaB [Pseudomonadota bacterium]MBT4975001.1 sodium/proton antiporter NhaB [Gammaproteobacteria bacterium]MDA9024073.1 sodium/proton antiporter NhaB [Gammaproteobacteria bacterium]MDA9174724.1 sodium/proton antiporter NhaB [Gammaproteobacteria bacterium]MDA9979479.1 sodium/proton antiporter NhaB [Gammaproteobacteria bacterium]